jgi:hypothetical protein
VFSLEYKIEGGGWAYARITNHSKSISLRTSYLNDTLKELAEAALCLAGQGTSAKVVFMDEPGEHQVFFEKDHNHEINYAVRWFDDWESRGMHPSDQFETLLKGTCSISRMKHQVTNVLWDLYTNLGEVKYLELWGEHPFPTELYKQLEKA